MVFANDYAAQNGKLKVYFIGHSENVQKADAFVVCYNGEVYLIDGGHTDTYHGLRFLLSLRKKYLKSEKALIHDIDCKLRVNLIVSHFHVDHVEALIAGIATNAFIDFANVYLPGAVTIPDEYKKLTRNSDKAYRPYLEKIIKKLHPRASIITIPYSADSVTDISCGDLSATIYPFPFDPASEEYLAYMCELYAKQALEKNGIADSRTKASTYALNAGSLWVRFALGSNSFLFTGDTMKKTDGEDGKNEAVDVMMRTYKDRIGKVTVLKYVHHGYARDTAAPYMLEFEPEYIILTTQIATAEDAVRAIDPDTKAVFVNSGLQTVLFECTRDSGTEITYIEE